MLLNSHDIAVVARVADRVGVMYAGKIVEVSDVYDIFEDSKHPYSTGLIQAAPSLLSDPENTRSIGGSPPNLLKLPSGCAFHPRCEYAMDICKIAVPGAVNVGEGHIAACHLHDANLRKEVKMA